jgi:hypothetical protein
VEAGSEQPRSMMAAFFDPARASPGRSFQQDVHERLARFVRNSDRMYGAPSGGRVWASMEEDVLRGALGEPVPSVLDVAAWAERQVLA